MDAETIARERIVRTIEKNMAILLKVERGTGCAATMHGETTRERLDGSVRSIITLPS
jgi:hypothetical protein